MSPDFVECLSGQGLQEWYKLMKSMGIAYHAKDKRKVLEVSGQLEDIENIQRQMTLKPGQDKSDAE